MTFMDRIVERVVPIVLAVKEKLTGAQVAIDERQCVEQAKTDLRHSLMLLRQPQTFEPRVERRRG